MPADKEKPASMEDTPEKSAPRPSVTEQIREAIASEVSLGTSWERRWQTLAMFSCSLYCVMPATLLIWLSFLSTLLRATQGLRYYSDVSSSYQQVLDIGRAGVTWYFVYLGFVLFDNSATTGSRAPFLRKLTVWWNHACDYLPLLLVKTAELPAGDGQRYVLGYHPHGIISVGCFCGFGTDGAKVLDLSATAPRNGREAGDDGARGFAGLFPRLDRRVVTLPTNFQTPFLREYLLHMGFLTSDRRTFRNFLAKPNTALIVVVGGAAESLVTKEGGIQLVLRTRRGFVREAIRAEASLVPIIAYGENDLYHIVDTDDARVSRVQAFVKRTFGFAMPLFQGRGLFFRHLGFMPERKQVVCIVGAPLASPTLKKANKDFSPEIDRATDTALNDDGKVLIEHHARYIQALEELNNRFKNASFNKPGMHRQASMQIVK